MTTDTPRTIAAVDLGSNSFHAVVARLQNGQLDILDRLREPVRLAEGLTDENRLDEVVRQRALDCLSRFGQRLKELPPGSVRAVGTNTLRRAQHNAGFLDEACQALGHPIEIISGVEEARLIYAGVSLSIAGQDQTRLVVDIGGGSTELIIGEDVRPVELESLYMGCVSYSKRYFPGGEISKSGMREAVLAGSIELEPIQQRFNHSLWQMATGASGTVKAIRDILRAQGWSEQGITWSGMKKLRKELLAAGQVDELRLEGLSENRRPVLPGGFAVLYAIFDALGVDAMNVSGGALREGVLYDMLGRLQHQDPRETSVDAMLERFHGDQVHARRVEQAAYHLFKSMREMWGLEEQDWQWLKWASRLHEVGLVVAHSGYHKHGAYLVQHVDLAGFTIQEQQFLATLVRGHRRKLPLSWWKMLPATQRPKCEYLSVILRLAVLLRRGRSELPMPAIEAWLEGDELHLGFPQDWLNERPLTVGDLQQEQIYLVDAGIILRYD